MPTPRPKDAPTAHHSACKGCGKLIVWGTTEEGKRIPLDPTPPTYVLVIHDGVAKASRSRAYVSHFATCPQANTFRGKHATKKED